MMMMSRTRPAKSFKNQFYEDTMGDLEWCATRGLFSAKLTFNDKWNQSVNFALCSGEGASSGKTDGFVPDTQCVNFKRARRLVLS